MPDRHAGSYLTGIVKLPRPPGRQTDAAVGGGIAGPMSFVHTKAWAEFHEVRHGCAEVMGAWRPGIFSDIHIGHDDAAIGIHVIAVET